MELQKSNVILCILSSLRFVFIGSHAIICRRVSHLVSKNHSRPFLLDWPIRHSVTRPINCPETNNKTCIVIVSLITSILRFCLPVECNR
jgi:hypothetical protein